MRECICVCVCARALSEMVGEGVGVYVWEGVRAQMSAPSGHLIWSCRCVFVCLGGDLRVYWGRERDGMEVKREVMG